MDVQQTSAPQTTSQQPQNLQQSLGSGVQAQPVSMAQPAQPQVVPQKRTQIHIFWWILGIIWLLLVLLVGTYLLFPIGKIVIDTQTPGQTIHVRKLVMTRPGWLVIYRLSPTDGIYQVASTVFLEPEEYIEFDLPIIDGEDIVSGDQLYGEIYADANADFALDVTIDTPMKDIVKRTVRTRFRVQ